MAYQPHYDGLLKTALRGLNHGSGTGPIETSGEKNVWSFIFKQKPAGDLVVIDAGANRGDYTESLLAFAGTKPVRIHCFEPSHATFALLSQHIRDDRVVLNCAGLSDKDGQADLFTDGPGSVAANLFTDTIETENTYLNTKETIALRSIDSYCREKDIKLIDFLKLDVEGNELNALRGAKDLMAAGGVHAIQFEVNVAAMGSRSYFRDYWRLLSGSFDLFRIVQDGLSKIERYEIHHEQFLGVNYLAVYRSSRN